MGQPNLTQYLEDAEWNEEQGCARVQAVNTASPGHTQRTWDMYAALTFQGFRDDIAFIASIHNNPQKGTTAWKSMPMQAYSLLLKSLPRAWCPVAGSTGKLSTGITRDNRRHPLPASQQDGAYCLL